MMSIVQLPGTTLTPETLLHQLLENKNNLKAVIIVQLDNEDSVNVSWSNMRADSMAYMMKIAEMETDRVIYN